MEDTTKQNQELSLITIHLQHLRRPHHPKIPKLPSLHGRPLVQ
jgi:hypothetical protein